MNRDNDKRIVEGFKLPSTAPLTANERDWIDMLRRSPEIPIHHLLQPGCKRCGRPSHNIGGKMRHARSRKNRARIALKNIFA